MIDLDELERRRKLATPGKRSTFCRGVGTPPTETVIHFSAQGQGVQTDHKGGTGPAFDDAYHAMLDPETVGALIRLARAALRTGGLELVRYPSGEFDIQTNDGREQDIAEFNAALRPFLEPATCDQPVGGEWAVSNPTIVICGKPAVTKDSRGCNFCEEHRKEAADG